MNLRAIITTLISTVWLLAAARADRIYLSAEDFGRSDSMQWVVPYHDDLLKAAFELRGATMADHACIDIYWSYDSLPDAQVHIASFVLSEPADNIYGSNAPTMEISIDGNTVGHLDKGLASRKGDNSLALEFDFSSSTLTVLAGSSYLQPVAKVSIPARANGVRFGVVAPERWLTDVAVASFEVDPAAALTTLFSDTDIADMVASSKESPVGYWRYLDRDCNPDYARLGGNYSLAIVPDKKPGDFLILYLDGAVTEPSRWQSGMVKGRLKATPFDGHYDLVWYDATTTPYSVECSATLEQPMVLRLDLPLLKASIRLAAVPQNQH
ncbi:MAG: hypothetical protein K2K79_08450 [Paramuribaculum sp.]|nr:hypothetical protein [Paramuribaculum sp.]